MNRTRIKNVTLVGGCLLIFSIFFVEGFRGRTIEEPSESHSSVSQPAESSFLQVGEELEYAVSYSFFNIGTISFKILDKGEREGRSIFKTRAIIESNPSLNWLKEVHIRFYGEVDDSIFSQYWISEDSSKSGIDYHSLTFHYGDSILVYEKGQNSQAGVHKVIEQDTLRVNGPKQDGLSLFFYARQYARHKEEVKVPVIIENKESIATINFQDKVEDADLDAVDYPVETVFLDGRADFVGVVGMTGGFRGWFSNDDARIPIVARLNVWLGSIKVQLKSWKRSGWQPPRYKKPD